MLETFELKRTLEDTRRELAHAIYQHDAACRVIARLLSERDQARAMLAKSGGAGAVAMAGVGADASTAMDAALSNGGGISKKLAKEVCLLFSPFFGVLALFWRCFGFVRLGWRPALAEINRIYRAYRAVLSGPLQITSLSKKLSKRRRKRTVPDELATKEDIAGFAQAAVADIHNTTDTTGATAIAVNPRNPYEVR